MDLNLTNKLALVTGSTAGIGNAIATALAREGAEVIVNGWSPATVHDAVARLKSATGPRVHGFASDLGTAEAAEEIARQYPDVEILVNNLGIFEPKPCEDIPDADWLRFFEVTVLSGVRLARLYVPAMKRRNWGRVIFISSESAVQIPSEMIHYGMTKTAQLAVSRGLAKANRLRISSRNFLRKFGQHRSSSDSPLEEVASLVTYIASPLSSATTGAALRVESAF